MEPRALADVILTGWILKGARGRSPARRLDLGYRTERRLKMGKTDKPDRKL